MQLPFPLRSGRVKPFTSIPRINWDHRLARGLLAYAFDCGNGVFMDLVAQRPMTKGIIGTPTLPGVVSTRYGQAYKLAAQAGATASVNWSSPHIAAYDNVTNTAPFAQATGLIMTAQTASGLGNPSLWALSDSSGNNQLGQTILIVPNVATPRFYMVNTHQDSGGVVAPNVYTSLIASCGFGSPNVTLWCMDDAGQNVITPITSTLAGLTGQAFNINDFYNPSSGSGSNSSSYFNGFIFYAAFWKRELTQSDASLLHNDPWGLLIFPEDEIFAEITPPTSIAGPSVISIINTKMTDTLTPSSPTNVVYSANTTANNGLLVSVGVQSVATLNTPTDSQGNAFTLVGTVTNATGGLLTSAWFVPKCIGGSNTVAVTYTGSPNFIAVGISEMTDSNGNPNGFALDAHTTLAASTANPSVTTAATTVASELVYGAITTDGVNPAAGTGYTGFNVGVNTGRAEERKFVTATGTQTVNYTATSANWALVAGTFYTITTAPTVLSGQLTQQTRRAGAFASPMARQGTKLFNYPLPVTPAAPVVTGNTLPVMGVG